MRYQMCFRRDLIENLAIVEQTGELAQAHLDPRVFLQLVLTTALIDQPISELRESFPTVEQAVAQADGTEVAVRDRLQVAVAAELLGLDPAPHLQVARMHMAQMLQAAGDAPAARSNAINQALGLSALEGGKDLEAAHGARMATPGTPGHEALDIELVALSRSLLDRDPVDSVALAQLATFPAYQAASEAGETMGPVIALLIALARRSEIPAGELLRSCISLLDEDLFPDGPSLPARVESSTPEWYCLADHDGPPRLERCVEITGTGGRLTAPDPIITPIITGLIRDLAGFMADELEAGGNVGTDTPTLVRSVLEHPQGEILARFDLGSGLDIEPAALEPSRARLEVGVEWIRCRHPRLRAQPRLEVVVGVA